MATESIRRRILGLSPLHRSPGVSRAARAFIASNGHPDRYLHENPDVAASGLDPVTHWCRSGAREGRRFPGLLAVPHDDLPQLRNRNDLTREPHVTIGAAGQQAFVVTVDAGYADELAFEEFVRAHGDGSAYLESNRDVLAAGIDPLQHWLDSGMAQGRPLPGIDVLHRDHSLGVGWRQLRWRGVPVQARRHQPLADHLQREIIRQADHEIALLAPGALASASLRRFDATDVFARDGLDLRAILERTRTRRRTVVIMRALVPGGAEKYLADLVRVLVAEGHSDVLVLVTDQREVESRAGLDLAVLAPFLNLDVVHLPDHVREGVELDATLVARLIHALGPSSLIIVNSTVALKAVRKYGRPLSTGMRIVCCFFSLAPGTPGSRFAQSVAPFSSLLTDNQRTADEAQRRFPYAMQQSPVVIPPRSPCNPDDVELRIGRRIERRAADPSSRRRRWLWVSRIEPQKGTGILAALARQRPEDEFQVHGPVEDASELEHLGLPNVNVGATLSDIDDVPTEDFDGFLFTSLVEGMPNIVLEMAARGIPVITTDVGGLRETFDDDALLFVDLDPDVEHTAQRFSEAIERLQGHSHDALAERLRKATLQLAARHADGVFAERVRALVMEVSA